MTQATQKRFLPVMTIAVLALNIIMYLIQFAYPAVLPALNRDPAALAGGEWWRLVTPMLVDPDPFWLVIIKFAGLAVIGPSVEGEMGRFAWIIIYLLGGVVGEIFGFSWDPNSAGYSLPLFGLIGALLFLLVVRRSVRSPAALLFALALIVGPIGQQTGEIWVIVLFGALLGSLGWVLLRRIDLLRRFAVWLGVAGLLSGVLLMGLADIHGSSLLTGAFLALVFFWTHRPSIKSQDR